jgi:hypothetical protein
MALSKIDVANMLTGATPVANGGTGLASGTSGQFLKFTGSTTLAGASAGIEVAGSFRLTTTFTGSANPITSNYEEDDTFYSRIGSAVTESSGVFTFPSTGVYLISAHTSVDYDGELNYHELILQGTTDGFSSDVQTIAAKYCSTSDHGTRSYFGASTAVMYDVTNVSNNKVRMRISSHQSGAQTVGHSSNNKTFLTFIRLGDT